eukprot:CAMPEP_0119343870 /NCGR_PEP_ID=MMETSP1333-20130426/106677_1 /TAXON_ID=418940 /ORGANISM="Scyphosphaera apsteinii, Strain RCC1455" /LENGTH=626 /DNA_ID=CAMNT_0007356287 /DNA_START=31 /DNA_END=1912 /DNA_ORIENTATION=+
MPAQQLGSDRHIYAMPGEVEPSDTAGQSRCTETQDSFDPLLRPTQLAGRSTQTSRPKRKLAGRSTSPVLLPQRSSHLAQTGAVADQTQHRQGRGFDPAKDEITLVASDGRLSVDRSAACFCTLIRHISEDSASDGCSGLTVPVPLVCLAQLESVLAFCKFLKSGMRPAAVWRLLHNRIAGNDAALLSLIAAANYLDARQCYREACGQLAKTLTELAPKPPQRLRERFGIWQGLLSNDEASMSFEEDLLTPPDSADAVISESDPLRTALCSDDSFESCLHLLNPGALRGCKRVSRAWRAAARRVASTPMWQAKQLTIQDLLWRGSWAEGGLLYAIRQMPEVLSQAVESSCGGLPLHVAAAYGCAEHVVREILEGYENAASWRNGLGDLPLHCAMRNPQVQPAVVRMLLDADSGSARAPNSEGKTPLHEAVRHMSGDLDSLDAPALLLARDEKAATIADQRGRLPLHLATRTEMIELLLTAYMEGAAHADHNGWLPLHWAMVQCASLKAQHRLLDAYPEAISHQDNAGRTPLQLAADYGTLGQHFLRAEDDVDDDAEGGAQEADASFEQLVYKQMSRFFDYLFPGLMYIPTWNALFKYLFLHLLRIAIGLKLLSSLYDLYTLAATMEL